MKYSNENNRTTRATMQEDIHRMIEDGFGPKEVPPFRLPPKVEQAIRTAKPVETIGWQVVFASFWFRAGMAAAAAILVVGLFLTVNQPREVMVKSYEIKEQTFQVIALDPSAQFNPDDVRFHDAPGFQADPTKGRWLGRLTPELADALRESFQSNQWSEIRRALKADEMDVPSKAPKHLVISDELAQLLQTDPEEVRLWVIQPNADVLQFTLAK
jgi:hypothetical protein